MTTLQKFISPKEWFSLEYPRMWELEVVDNIPCFFDPIHGQGAFQAFSIQIGPLREITEELKHFDFLSAENISEKMHCFLKNQNIQIPIENLIVYRKKDVDFIPYEYVSEDHFYMICMLQKKQKFLLTLYNCAGKPTAEEAEIVGKIVNSINIH